MQCNAMQCNAMQSFRKPTSEQFFLYGVVCFVIECGNLQPVQRVLSAIAVFFSLVIIYQIESLISIGILSISLFYNSESIDTLGLKGHINCCLPDQSLGNAIAYWSK